MLAMIKVEAWWLYTEPMDMRKGTDGLMNAIFELTGQSIQRRAAYLFCNRNGTRMKAVIFDGAGYWCCLRRLEKGRFVWPSEGKIEMLQAEQFAWLSCGLDWKRWNENLPNPLWM
jgi:transposase